MSLRSIYDVAAPAKLNLFLHVVGRRADGYHLLQSLVVLIDWCDTLHFELRGDGRLARHDTADKLPDDDLCLRAARALQQASGTSFGADITVDKRVPSGAGMGGGSSDAASTLLALNRLWRLRWPLARLLPLGLALGADVPFFLGGRNAVVEGIGERLTPAGVRRRWLAVVKPAASLQTAAVFSSPLLMPRRPAAILESLIGGGGAADFDLSDALVEAGQNDLQRAAEAESIEVAQAASLVAERFGNSRMTGSGSAVFARVGLIDGTGGGAAVAMPDLPGPGWVGRMCASLEAHPLLGWAAE